MIVLDSDCADDLVNPAATGFRDAIQRTSALDDAVGAYRAYSAQPLITDFDTWWPGAMLVFGDAGRAVGWPIAAVWRTRLAPRALAELSRLNGLESWPLDRVHISVRSCDPNLNLILADGEFERTRNATMLILLETLALVPEECRHTYVATIAACERRISARQVAAVGGMPTERDQRDCTTLALPPHPELNAAVLLAHAARRFVSGASPAECAQRAGIGGPDELHEYCRLHTGEPFATFAAFAARSGVTRSIERLCTWLLKGMGDIPLPACCL